MISTEVMDIPVMFLAQMALGPTTQITKLAQLTHRVTVAHLTPGVTIGQPPGQMTAAAHTVEIEMIAFLRQDVLSRGKESNQ